jgi:hypothetical protein
MEGRIRSPIVHKKHFKGFATQPRLSIRTRNPNPARAVPTVGFRFAGRVYCLSMSASGKHFLALFTRRTGGSRIDKRDVALVACAKNGKYLLTSKASYTMLL